MTSALTMAAKRGVDVRIVTPGIPDKKIVYSVTRSYYNALARKGVRIFEYTSGFCHCKMSVCDDIMATCGTINMDYRSLYHHFECAAYCYNTGGIAELEKDFEETLKKCKKITKKNIWGKYPYLKPLSFILKVFAPLL